MLAHVWSCQRLVWFIVDAIARAEHASVDVPMRKSALFAESELAVVRGDADGGGGCGDDHIVAMKRADTNCAWLSQTCFVL